MPVSVARKKALCLLVESERQRWWKASGRRWQWEASVEKSNCQNTAATWASTSSHVHLSSALPRFLRLAQCPRRLYDIYPRTFIYPLAASASNPSVPSGNCTFTPARSTHERAQELHPRRHYLRRQWFDGGVHPHQGIVYL